MTELTACALKFFAFFFLPGPCPRSFCLTEPVCAVGGPAWPGQHTWASGIPACLGCSDSLGPQGAANLLWTVSFLTFPSIGLYEL